MSKTPDNMLEFRGKSARACRVAYTLNNTQPVRCSLIGEEPLFYMDFESAETEDAAFDDAFGFDAIDAGLAALQEKIESLDRLSAGPERPAAETIGKFFDDADYIVTPGKKEDPGDIAWLAAVMRKSRLAAAYLDLAERHGAKQVYGAQNGDGFYDRRHGIIFINPALEKADRILLAARELRRLWQHRNGALLHPLTFHPDQAILINRAQVADLAGSMVRIAWELQLAGEKDAWDRIENSSMADLGRAFARESCLDFRTLNNGSAASAVFEAWFLSERCRQEDRRLIQQMLADFQGYVFDIEQPSQNLGAELIAALGTMPFGKNYLAPYVQTITTDPVFTEVRDRSNANFLWFIKFERSFRETEQELQTSQPVGRPEGLQGAVSNKKRIGDHEKTASIVSLPGGRADASPAAGKRAGTRRAGGGAQIIEFHPGMPAE